MVNLHTPMSTTSSCQPHHQVQSAKYTRDCAESSISRKKAKRLSGRGSSGCARRRLRVRNGIDPMARPCCAGLQMEVTKRAQKSIRDAVALLLYEGLQLEVAKRIATTATKIVHEYIE